MRNGSSSVSPQKARWKVIADPYESRILGIDDHLMTSPLSEPGNIVDPSPLKFWSNLVEQMSDCFPNSRKIGLLSNTGPYMDRDSVYAVRLLEAAQECKMTAALYCYLDGIHMGNSDQKPSEFENIGAALTSLGTNTAGLEMWGCSRCATARGYVDHEDESGLFHSQKTIPPFELVNLNKIVDRMEESFPILGLPGGLVVRGRIEKETKPALLIFITRPPYGSEWSFGGISLAMAAWNHGIPVKVIFIENGVLGLVAAHSIAPQDKIFNSQEVIMALDEDIPFYVYSPSLESWPPLNPDLINSVQVLDDVELANVFWGMENPEEPPLTRIFFF